MKTRDQVLDPLRVAVQAAGGEFRPVWLETKDHTVAYQRLILPVPGYSNEHIRFQKMLGAFAVSVRGAFGATWRFEYDEEFLNLKEWTVINGLFTLIVEYKIPEKYKAVVAVEPTPVDEFMSKYGVEYGT